MATIKNSLVFIALLIANTAFADSYSKEEKTTNFIVTPSVTYRYDIFKWSISHPDCNKKLSELIWKNHIIQPGIKLEIEPKSNQFTFLGQVKYGYILKNPSKSWDLDWFPDKYESVLESKTKSAVKGNILDLSGAVGYSVNLFNNNLLTFYVGYDYTDYRNKQYGSHQLLDENDLSIPSNQLVSKYYFKTQYPWVGLSVNTPLNDKFLIIPTIKFYSFNYVGKGYWLFRDDLQQNPSFKHTAKGKGLGFDVDFIYIYSDNLSFTLNLENKRFKMINGKDQIFFSEKTKKSAFFNFGKKVSDNKKLYGLSLISSSISIGLKYKL